MQSDFNIAGSPWCEREGNLLRPKPLVSKKLTAKRKNLQS